MIQLQQLINSLQRDSNYLRALKQARRSCFIEEGELKTLTPSSVFLYIQHLFNKNYTQNENKVEGLAPGENIWSDRWHPNQHKHFSWLVVGYFYIKNIPLRSFTQQDIDFFAKIFVNKEKIFLQYHLLSLIKQSKSKREVWSKQETQLLYQLMNSQKYKGKWSDISYRLYYHSNKAHFRSSHKCREMWFNHLNPNVRHHKWTLQEDILLFQMVTRDGTKWAQISKGMEGVRTQHMVKNRFNSLIKKYSLKYQRYSLKKLAEIIQKDLQNKLINHEGSQDSKQENKLQNMEEEDQNKLQNMEEEDQIKVEKEEGKEQIMFVQPQQKQEEHQNYSKVIVNNITTSLVRQKKCQENTGTRSSLALEPKITQFNFFIPEPLRVEKQRPGVEKEATKAYQNQQADQQNLKMDMVHMQWAIMCKAQQVELIDYLGVQYEFKQTIFSGTN